MDQKSKHQTETERTGQNLYGLLPNIALQFAEARRCLQELDRYVDRLPTVKQTQYNMMLKATEK